MYEGHKLFHPSTTTVLSSLSAAVIELACPACPSEVKRRRELVEGSKYRLMDFMMQTQHSHHKICIETFSPPHKLKNLTTATDKHSPLPSPLSKPPQLTSLKLPPYNPPPETHHPPAIKVLVSPRHHPA